MSLCVVNILKSKNTTTHHVKSLDIWANQHCSFPQMMSKLLCKSLRSPSIMWDKSETNVHDLQIFVVPSAWAHEVEDNPSYVYIHKSNKTCFGVLKSLANFFK